MNVRSPEFQRGDFLPLANNPGDIDIAYVCLDDDALGLHAGLILLQLLRGQKTSIVVRMAEKGGLATLLQGKVEGESYFEFLSAFAFSTDLHARDPIESGGGKLILSSAGGFAAR